MGSKRQLLEWDGAKWVGADIPDYSTAAPGSDVGPFIMQPEGMGRLFATDKMAEGPFPEHYEPFETPLGTNPLHPNVVSNPAARVFRTIWRRWANPTSSLRRYHLSSDRALPLLGPSTRG